MPQNSLNFGILLLPIIRKVYGDEYAQYPEEYSRIYEMDTSKRAYEEDHNISTLGLVPRKKQGQAVSYDAFYDGWTTRYTHDTFGLGFIVTRELYDDAQYRNIKAMPKALARSVRQTIEIDAANVLNNAFDVAHPIGDGLQIGSNVHKLISGGTFSNVPSVPADLDVTSFEQATIDIALNWLDERGLKMMAMAKKLIVHQNNNFQAQMLLKSSGLPDTANNNINPAQNLLPGGYEILHWLSDPNAWFIQTDVPNGLTCLWRDRPEFTQDNDFDTENAKYKTRYRKSMGLTDPRGIYSVAGSAYTGTDSNSY